VDKTSEAVVVTILALGCTLADWGLPPRFVPDTAGKRPVVLRRPGFQDKQMLVRELGSTGKVAGATDSSVLADVTADSRAVEERRNCEEDILAVKA
jgi:hypothetical protein